MTPVYNSAKYVEQTIRSVLAQNYPNLEYFVIDGGSTDGTIDIIRKYESQISGWISEPDKGMYDAINKGFAHTSGEIMGWISATDKLHTGGLSVVGSVFRDMPPEVEWITGRRTVFNEQGKTVRVDPVLCWSRYRFLIGASRRHIQQESTYWRRSLWEKAGSHVDGSLRSAGDFELWVRFFRHARLYSVDSLIGGFREHPDSDSLAELAKFNGLCDEMARAELLSRFGKRFEVYRRIDAILNGVPKLGGIWYRSKSLALRCMYSVPGSDIPPVIEDYNGSWRVRRARFFSPG